ncbi:MAG: sulfotransferase domain-containing protein [Candidatus Woykebacteria bacterium]
MLNRIKNKFQRVKIFYQNDVQLISYPKCGRTWLRLLIGKIIEFEYKINSEDPSDLEDVYMVCKQNNITIPLIIVSHDDNPQWKSAENIETDKKKYKHKKVVFLVRDPRDVIVSSFYQKKYRKQAYKGNIDELIFEEKGGLLSLLHFYNVWAKNYSVPKSFHLVHYEALKKEPFQELRSLLNFLSLEKISDESIHKAIEFCSFQNMRKMEKQEVINIGRLTPTDKLNTDTYKTRKGKIGGYREELKPETINYMDKEIKKRLDNFFEIYK